MDFGLGQYKSKWNRILLHVLFWIGYICFFFLQYTFFGEKMDYASTAASLSLTALIDIGASYFTVYFLLPKFLFKKKYWQFGVIFFFSASLAIILQRVFMYYISYPYFYTESMSKAGTFWHINPFYTFFNIYTVVGFFTAIKLLKYWYQNQQTKAELENKNKTSELALLRNQLNPHFLFNTLNNIDSLIMTNPAKASDAIIKLSDIMRFMLYDTSTDVVPLEKEINYLKSYISLQQMRLKEPGFVKVDIEGNCMGKNIAPMLFIPFVENAFKHGYKNVSSPGISIRLQCQKDSINFEVTNHIDQSGETNKDNTAGIGLANTKRRLELLYPDRHILSIDKKNGQYKSQLTINY
jgi:two-component system, LytTR family, sensor kinase